MPAPSVPAQVRDDDDGGDDNSNGFPGDLDDDASDTDTINPEALTDEQRALVDGKCVT